MEECSCESPVSSRDARSRPRALPAVVPQFLATHPLRCKAGPASSRGPTLAVVTFNLAVVTFNLAVVAFNLAVVTLHSTWQSLHATWQSLHATWLSMPAGAPSLTHSGRFGPVPVLGGQGLASASAELKLSMHACTLPGQALLDPGSEALRVTLAELTHNMLGLHGVVQRFNEVVRARCWQAPAGAGGVWAGGAQPPQVWATGVA